MKRIFFVLLIAVGFISCTTTRRGVDDVYYTKKPTVIVVDEPQYVVGVGFGDYTRRIDVFYRGYSWYRPYYYDLNWMMWSYYPPVYTFYYPYVYYRGWYYPNRWMYSDWNYHPHYYWGHNHYNYRPQKRQPTVRQPNDPDVIRRPRSVQTPTVVRDANRRSPRQEQVRPQERRPNTQPRQTYRDRRNVSRPDVVTPPRRVSPQPRTQPQRRPEPTERQVQPQQRRAQPRQSQPTRQQREGR